MVPGQDALPVLRPARPDGGAELDGLFVEPDRWRGGLRRSPVDEAARLARAQGAAALHVIDNPNALGSYERVGFLRDGKARTFSGPAPRLVRDLG